MAAPFFRDTQKTSGLGSSTLDMVNKLGLDIDNSTRQMEKMFHICQASARNTDKLEQGIATMKTLRLDIHKAISPAPPTPASENAHVEEVSNEVNTTPTKRF
jgi:hypothetical protein